MNQLCSRYLPFQFNIHTVAFILNFATFVIFLNVQFGITSFLQIPQTKGFRSIIIPYSELHI